MNLQLQNLRKAAGYKSRDDFANAIGVKPGTYKTWETGTRNMSFEQACMVADTLKCSLDELAGRTAYVGTYSDARQEQLNADYSQLSESKKEAAADTVRGMLIGERRREREEKSENIGPSGDSGRQAAIA